MPLINITFLYTATYRSLREFRSAEWQDKVLREELQVQKNFLLSLISWPFIEDTLWKEILKNNLYLLIQNPLDPHKCV